jgi:hypothetical protein
MPGLLTEEHPSMTALASLERRATDLLGKPDSDVTMMPPRARRLHRNQPVKARSKG